ncbi:MULTISPECIES: hypothetical protein [Arthrobacter]|uniref:Uncharacterized protein n=1 Tax=Arthrobacter oryzae TaxID=409290 RepID=A0A3N0BXZ5_9MICC|nr:MULTISPECIES: hypothetical protein [Arthrobacter]QYF91217.1 hypothetical protein KY499_08620 [Arthrobacter sp. PAMC25284]RNL54382.1 hypothetical protein D7003_11175 [Arthrobacter oryzae]
MTAHRFRRPLLIIAASIAVFSLTSVGTVMAMAAHDAVAPGWITSTALYGLPLAFLLMLFLVIMDVVARRRPPEPQER